MSREERIDKIKLCQVVIMLCRVLIRKTRAMTDVPLRRRAAEIQRYTGWIGEAEEKRRRLMERL